MSFYIPILSQVGDFDYLRSFLPKKSVTDEKTSQTVGFSDDDIKELLSVKVGNKILLSSSSPGVVYDVISMIYYIGLSPTIANLKSLVESKTINEENYTRFLIFESKIFQKQQESFDKDLSKMQQKPEPVQGLVQCPKCKSKNTVTDYIQTRRADEGYTFITICNNCGTRSRL